MRAIVSDIHANIEAAHAVFEDIAKHGAEEIVCLGDIVGYGPHPEEAVDLVEKMCRFCLSGNHDYAVLTHAERFNPLAEEAVDFTRSLLKPTSLSFGRKRARWQFLENLPTRVEEADILYVHGSPRDDRNEYILESDIVFGNIGKIEEILEITPRLCFTGHTHVPGIIGEELRFMHPQDFGERMDIEPGKKYLVNVGSVGQPRDGDNRASYLLTNGNHLTFRRVPYNFRQTMTNMSRVGPISQEAAARLEYGR